MADMTLLDYVQQISSSLDEDEINNYDDTVVSLQIARIVKTMWTELQNRADLPEHYSLFELTASNDNTQPILMYRPDNVDSILWIKYDKRLVDQDDKYMVDIPFCPLEEFLKRMYQLKPETDEGNLIDSFELNLGGNIGTVDIFYRNDTGPSYYTTFNDRTIIFDSYDASVDDTLQKDKTLCYGHMNTDFIMSNTFVPFIDRDMSQLLLNEAKVLAFAELKQVGHDVAKQWANRGWSKLNKGKRGVDQNRDELSRAPDYSRKR